MRALYAASTLANRSSLRADGWNTPLLCQGRQVLLTTLECIDFLAGRVLKIHCKEQGPDHQSGHAGGNILTDLEALLRSKLTDFLVVGFDLGRDGRAIGISILRLNNRDGLRRPTRARPHRYRTET